MRNMFLFAALLAAGMTVSAWMGIEDALPESGRSAQLNNSQKHPLLREGEGLIWDPNSSPRPPVPAPAPRARRGSGQASETAGLAVGQDFGPHYEPAYSSHKFYQSTRRLESLAKPLGRPRPGDWRSQVREPEQDFGQFVHDSRRANGALVIQPIGDLPKDQKRAIGHLLDSLSAFFGMRAVCAAPLPLSELPSRCFRQIGGTRQINAEALMDLILRPLAGGEVSAVVAITDFDLYPGESWPFATAFCWSSFNAGAAVVSTASILKGTSAGRESGLLRLTKLCLHEVAHTLALKHCSRFNCLMNGSGSLRESDSKPLSLCPDCLAKLSLVTGRAPESHVKDMFELCRSKGFEAEARHYKSAWRLFGL